jgi:transposase-like protein/IS1 family transposase
MNSEEAFCPNPDCPLHGIREQDNIHVHSHKEKRYRCHRCNKTFAETKGTPFYRRKYNTRFISEVVSLLAYGCPPQAIVATYGLDERTVYAWQAAAGQHSKRLHEHLLRPMDLVQVQADELRVKAQGQVLWMALAIGVTTRLWLGGVVSRRRDKAMVLALAFQVRACALCRPLLVIFDGFAAYVAAFRQAFRSPLKTGGRGRPRLVAWPKVVLGQVVKRHAKWKLLGILRRLVVPKVRIMPPDQRPIDAVALAADLLGRSQSGGVLNTAYIERLNATFRARLAGLVRRTRALVAALETLEAGMYLVGCVYNFCSWHQSLRVPLYVLGCSGEQRRWVGRTPAMAAGLTDHRWSVEEWLGCQVLAVPAAAVQRRKGPSKTAVFARAA